MELSESALELVVETFVVTLEVSLVDLALLD